MAGTLGLFGMDPKNQQMLVAARQCIEVQSDALFTAAQSTDRQSAKTLPVEKYGTLLWTKNKLATPKSDDKEKTKLIKQTLITVLDLLIAMYQKIVPQFAQANIAPKPYVIEKDPLSDAFTKLWERIVSIYEILPQEKTREKKVVVVYPKSLPLADHEAQKLATIFEKVDPDKNKNITEALTKNKGALNDLLGDAIARSHVYLVESFLKNDKLAHKIFSKEYNVLINDGLTKALASHSQFRFINLLINKGAKVDKDALLTLLTETEPTESIASFTLKGFGDFLKSGFFKTDKKQEKTQKSGAEENVYKTVVSLLNKGADVNASKSGVTVLRGALRYFYKNLDNDESLKIIKFLLEKGANPEATTWHEIFTNFHEKQSEKNLSKLIKILAEYKNMPWKTIIEPPRAEEFSRKNQIIFHNPEPAVFIRSLIRLNDPAVAEKIYKAAPEALCKAIDHAQNKINICKNSLAALLASLSAYATTEESLHASAKIFKAAAAEKLKEK